MVSRKDEEAKGCFWGLLGKVLFCTHFFGGVIWEFACCHLLIDKVGVLAAIFYMYLVSRIFLGFQAVSGRKYNFIFNAFMTAVHIKTLKVY